MVRDIQGRPDVVGAAEMTVRASAEEVLALVLDPWRYRAIDPRLHRIHWVRRSDDGLHTLVRFTPRLGPVPAVLSSTQRIVLDPGRGVRITPEPSWTDAVARFRGSLTCEPVDDGILVRRRLEFWLARPLRPLLAGPLQRWLDHDVPAELGRLRSTLEGCVAEDGEPRPPDPAACGPGSDPAAERAVRAVLTASAVVAAASGAAVALRGTAAVPGGGTASASTESVLRFYAVWWAAQGLAIRRVLRAPVLDEHELRRVCLTTFAGGAARLAAARARGRPHALFRALTAVELVVPPVLLALHRVAGRRRTTPAAAD